MAGNNMRDALDALDAKDVYTLLLYALYRMKGVPEYATLSEIAFVLDDDNLTKFLKVFGGATIKVPTVHELDVMVRALRLYWEVDLRGRDVSEALRECIGADIPASEVKEAYRSLRETMRGSIPSMRRRHGSS